MSKVAPLISGDGNDNANDTRLLQDSFNVLPIEPVDPDSSNRITTRITTEDALFVRGSSPVRAGEDDSTNTPRQLPLPPYPSSGHPRLHQRTQAVDEGSNSGESSDDPEGCETDVMQVVEDSSPYAAEVCPMS